MRVARYVGRVEERDGQRDDPDPEHLKDPEAEEGEELTAHLIEALIFARLENAEEEESCEAQRPDYHEEGHDKLARVLVRATKGECEDGEDSEVGATSEVCFY